MNRLAHAVLPMLILNAVAPNSFAASREVSADGRRAARRQGVRTPRTPIALVDDAIAAPQLLDEDLDEADRGSADDDEWTEAPRPPPVRPSKHGVSRRARRITMPDYAHEDVRSDVRGVGVRPTRSELRDPFPEEESPSAADAVEMQMRAPQRDRRGANRGLARRGYAFGADDEVADEPEPEVRRRPGGPTPDGRLVIHPEVGWPSLSLSLRYSPSASFEGGGRFTLVYGLEGSLHVMPGMLFQGDLRFRLVDGARVSCGIEFAPGIGVYFLSRGASVDFRVPLTGVLGIRIARSAALQVLLTAPLIVGTYNGEAFFSVPLLLGPGFQLAIDRHVSLMIRSGFGPYFDTANGVEFAFQAVAGVSIRL